LGFPRTGTIGFGLVDEIGLSLVPNPPARITAFIYTTELIIRTASYIVCYSLIISSGALGLRITTTRNLKS